jgi:hypothetical protein
VVRLNLESVWVFSSNTTFYGYLKVVIVVKSGMDTGQRVVIRSDQFGRGSRMQIAKKRERQETNHSYQSMRPDRNRKKKRDDEIKDASEDAPPRTRTIYHVYTLSQSSIIHLLPRPGRLSALGDVQ